MVVESTHDLSSRDSLEGRCQRLQNQVREMEVMLHHRVKILITDMLTCCSFLPIPVLQSFLNDYGLIWVGDGESSDSAESQPAHNAERGLWQPGTFHLLSSL